MMITSRNPYGIPTNARGQKRKGACEYKLISSEGEGYIPAKDILSNKKTADRYKVMITLKSSVEPQLRRFLAA